ncbi:MAG: DUF115 domain-containing protein [Desulfobacterales bacterium]|nr:DUF115 domain-containing protein [Desulfobacterales bacterium]
MPGQVEYFSHNCSLLKKRYPHIYDMLSRLNWPKTGQLTHTMPQAPNLEVRLPNTTVSLHPSDNPKLEGLEQIKRVPQDGYDVVLWMGLGLGYGPQNALEKRPNIQFLAIFEADPGIFVQAMYARDLTWLFANPRVLFHVGTQIDIEKVLLPARNSLLVEDIQYLKHKTSVELFPQAYQLLDQIVFNYANNLSVSGSTAMRFGPKMFTNRLHNLSLMRYTNILEDLQGVFKGIPAYLVAAGPSLNKSVKELKKINGHGLIIAVDSAIPILLNEGVMPHFVGALDFHDIIFEKAASDISRLDQTILLCGGTVTPLVPKRFPTGKICWAFTETYMDSWLHKQLGGSSEMSRCGQVADLNFFAATVMGCSPIVLVGQDLCFEKGKQSHAAGVVHASNGPVRYGGDDSAESLIPVPGNYTAKVETNRVFLNGIRTFEALIEECPGRYINATNGGAYIKGTEVMPLKDVIAQFSNESIDVATRLRAPMEKGVTQRQKKFETLFDSTIEEINGLKRIIKTMERAYRKLQPAFKRLVKRSNRPLKFSELSPSLQKKTNEIVDGFNKLNEIKTFELFSELTFEALRKTERQRKQLEKLAGKPEQYMEWLTGQLAYMIQVNSYRFGVLDNSLREIERLTAYWVKSGQLEAKIDNAKDSQAYLDLIRGYVKYGDWILARPLIKHLDEKGVHTPELAYFRGALALYYGDYEAAELAFEQARKDDTCAHKIATLRKSWGDHYMQNALWAQEIHNDPLERKMVVKGLKASPEHVDLKKTMQKCLREDILSCSKDQAPNQDMSSLLFWEESFNNNETLIELVPEEDRSDFYQLMIQRDSTSQEYGKALEWCQKLSEIKAENPDIYFMMADLYYSMNDLDMTLENLKKAIAIQPQYLEAWYNLGDDLQNAQQYDKALKVFEQGFLSMPQQINFLKKMGDCYTVMGETQAAQEAYKQFKARQ